MNKNNYNPPSLDDLQSDYRVTFSDYEIFDAKKFSKEINLINEIDFLIDRLGEYSAALKTDDREGLAALLKEGTDSKKQAK